MATKVMLFVAISLVSLFVGIRGVSAAELFFGAHSKEVGLGKPFEIGVFLNTQNEVVNAVDGEIIFPGKSLELVDVIDGNSIISLWIEKPHSKETGKVFFSGIVPGGYFGEKGQLFSIVFRPKDTGPVTLQTSNERVLLHDGEGTPASINRAPLSLSVAPETGAEAFLPPHDSDLPEDFTPIISRDPSIFDNKHFLSFAAQDKISGIDHYEIQETKSKKPRDRGWRIGESPYLLQDQNLRSYVFVKAVDRAGNERIVMLPPQTPLPWYENYWLWIIIIVLALTVYLSRQRSLWERVISTLKPSR